MPHDTSRALLVWTFAALAACTSPTPAAPSAPRPPGLASDAPLARPLRVISDPESPRALLLGWRAEVADVIAATAVGAR